MPNATPTPESHTLPLHDRVYTYDPKLINLAPELATVPMMGAVSSHYLGNAKAAAKQVGQEIAEELTALFASLDLIGIKEALKATPMPDGSLKLWDGRHRLLWACQRDMAGVPVQHVTEEEGLALVEATVVGRRHWTKGQRAYLGVRLHPEVIGVGKGRPVKSDAVGITAVELANRIGVSPDLIGQAVELYRLFYAPGHKPKSAEAIEAAEKCERYEMSIWAGMGLGAVIAGIGGGGATQGKDKAASGFHGLEKPFATLARFSQLFGNTWTAEEKGKAQKLMMTQLRDLHPDFRLTLSEALAAAEI